MAQFNVTFENTTQLFDLGFYGDEEFDLDMTTVVQVAGDPYTGEYEFTPSEEMQTIEIADKQATSNIIIKPIPQNYGLITWNGSTLTVS